MFHVLLHIHTKAPNEYEKGRYDPYLIGIKTDHFINTLPGGLQEFMLLATMKHETNIVHYLNQVGESGLAMPLCFIFPGSITLRRIPAYLNPPCDLEITLDENTHQLVCGDTVYNTWFDKICQARAETFVKDVVILKHPLARDANETDVTRNIEYFSVALGFWDAIKTERPELMQKRVLTAVGFLTAKNGFFLDEPHRSDSNHITVAGMKTSDMRSTMRIQGALIGDRAINPTRDIDGPLMPEMERLANPALCDIGYNIGTCMRDFSYEAIIGAWFQIFGTRFDYLMSSSKFHRIEAEIDSFSAHETAEAALLQKRLSRILEGAETIRAAEKRCA